MKSWISASLSQVRQGGSRVVVRKLKRLIGIITQIAIWGVMAPFAIVFVVLMRVLRPWLLIRVGAIRSDRIGHFGIDPVVHLAEHILSKDTSSQLDLFWVPQKTCNAQWARMVRRNLHVYWWVRFVIPVNLKIPGGAGHHIVPAHSSVDLDGVINQTQSFFDFTDEENRRAEAWLKKRGWTEGAPFVCLLTRDYMYLEKGADKNWSYHDYRNTDIDAYLEAVRTLVSKGFWVVRMGKVMQKRLSFEHPHVIDYPFVPDQDDLLDIWLSAKCSVFISTGTGLDAISDAYLVPSVYVNAIPIGHMRSYANVVWVPKNLVWKKTGRELTLREHLHHNYVRSEEYEDAGIDIVDLTTDEIGTAVDEMTQRLAGSWQEAAADKKRQEQFWGILKAWPDFAKHHNWIHPQSRVGSHWLKHRGNDFFN